LRPNLYELNLFISSSDEQDGIYTKLLKILNSNSSDLSSSYYPHSIQ